MTIYDELDLLDQAEAEAEELAGELELYGVGRREFVFFSLAAAAATTFGFGARALAQAPGGGAAQQVPQAPPPPLGNGDPVSWTVPAVSRRYWRR
jgi:hypothetical protein